MSQLDSQREVSAVDSEAQRSGREPGGPGVPDGHQGALGLGQPSLMGSQVSSTHRPARMSAHVVCVC